MIITSLLDTDFYKLTMMQVVFLNYPEATARYRFFNRSAVNLAPYLREVKREVDQLCELRFTSEEIDYLWRTGLFNTHFLGMLSNFKLSRSSVWIDNTDNDNLSIDVKGLWWETVLFEVPLLAIVNEVYFNRQTPIAEVIGEGGRRLKEKCQLIKEGQGEPFQLMEFGTRRRFSREWQDVVVHTLQQQVPQALVGTSNVNLARKYGLKPMGTMAHEWLQAHQALGPLKEFQQRALETWMNAYRGELGIALTDCITYDRFERIFDKLLAKAYDGLRHDSGSPHVWADRVLNHYRYLGIDARTKTAVFSDGLDIPKAQMIQRHFGPHINCIYGIGTNLTNDLGLEPLKIVMKMIQCNGQSVAKISDEPGKAMHHDPTYLQHLTNTFYLEP